MFQPAQGVNVAFFMELVSTRQAAAKGPARGQRTPSSATRVAGDEESYEYDALVRVLHVQCTALERAGVVRFNVAGFGQEAWPVDVSTDLAVILEQLPRALRHIDEDGASSQLDFFEQGVERLLTLRTEGDRVLFECTSMTEWRPEPEIETMPVTEARRMLEQLRDDYVIAVFAATPELAGHVAFEAWARRAGIQVRTGEKLGASGSE